MNYQQEHPMTHAGRNLNHQFEFYFIALIFTILGLAVQTSSTTEILIQIVFEISSWVSLLLSGLVGLSRLEWLPFVYDAMAKKAILEDKADAFKKAKLIINESDGNTLSKQDKERKKNELIGYIDALSKKIDKIQKEHVFKYKAMKFFFGFGITMLVLARAVALISKIGYVSSFV